MISITLKDIQTEVFNSNGVITIDQRRGVNPGGKRSSLLSFILKKSWGLK